jgi:sigma-B regulation protein RsbU (phosphoserine phosphatase)
VTHTDHHLFRSLISNRKESLLEWLSTASVVGRDDGVPAKVIEALEKALDRIQEPDLGTCEMCRGSLERELAAVCPDSPVCFECMGESERGQLEADLRQVQEVNRELLPRVVPEDGRWEIGIHYTPSRILSGDFYDVRFVSGKKSMNLTVGDVAGKGLSAGLLRASLQATMRVLNHQCDSPAELLQSANQNFFTVSGSGRFASVFYGVLDDEDGSLVYANGGHLPPLLRRASGGWEQLEATGTVLGILEDVRYEQRSVSLEPGDLLVLYTDGITEAEEPSGIYFEEQNLMAAVDASATLPARGIAASVAAELERFSPGPPGDDRTLLVLRRKSD